ncbi:aldose epimerase family protein [Actinocatenispora comari]|uniref:Aldose 1-epimerase n=1 Tax=Actinocatenispora comari TaxID=2807577 RepID=A0A8J4AAV0_9ACTN|nr:aldose epimerase family protein [Actinocatenispora comari]GIL26959.1 aldose 1-epimerase [Actinocatenispora comari]
MAAPVSRRTVLRSAGALGGGALAAGTVVGAATGADPAAASEASTPRPVTSEPDGLVVGSDPFGTMPDGTPVTRYTLGGGRGLQVQLLDYGATVHRVLTPDRHRRRANVALGLSTLDEYRTRSPYFGAIVGRYANRIAKGRFTLDGHTYQIPVNDGENALHGGTVGFDKHVWDAEIERGHGSVGVRFRLVSPEGDMGFPGTLTTTVTYTLTARGELTIGYHATTDQATVINLSNHTYWNLGGEGSGSVYDHLLWIDADRYTAVDGEAIPLGTLPEVAGTPFDFRRPTAIGARIRAGEQQLINVKGYDHNWVLNGSGQRRVATVFDPASGRHLTFATDQPGLQFYAGNQLDGTLVGIGGRTYRQSDTLVLETQHFPDSPNQPDFPSTTLRPGEVFRTATTIAFGVA